VQHIGDIKKNNSEITITDSTNGVFVTQKIKKDTVVSNKAGTISVASTDSSKRLGSNTANAGLGAPKKSDPSIKATIDSTKKTINSLSVYYKQTTGIELGYKDWDEAIKLWFNCGKYADPDKCWFLELFKKILGILITAFALQLGSNYWFDILNKAVNMRAAGKNPNEQKK
jgi:hypothetical protein